MPPFNTPQPNNHDRESQFYQAYRPGSKICHRWKITLVDEPQFPPREPEDLSAKENNLNFSDIVEEFEMICQQH